MARKASDIVLLMDAEQATHSELTSLNSPSQTAEYTLWKETIAAQMNAQEQLWDTLRDEINSNIAKAAPGTDAWIQAQVFKYQYSATNPQVLQMIDLAPGYPIVDPSLRIVTRCSVKTDLNKIVQIKVAQGEPPFPIILFPFTSLYGYVSKIMFDGIDFNVSSQVSDKLYISAEVFYDGQYSSSIQTNVETSISAYLASVPFNGIVKVSEIENAIQAVPGVTDVKLNTIKARPDTIALAFATTIYDIAGVTPVNAREWATIAGYIIPETTGGSTLANTITYTVS